MREKINHCFNIININSCHYILVGEGEDPNDYNPWEITAATISIQRIFTILSISMMKKLFISTVDDKGCITTQLNKVLYGLRESATL